MIDSLAGIGRFGVFSWSVATRVVTPYWEIDETARHTWEVASRCAMPVVAVVFPFGMVMALQGLSIFDLFGAQRLLSSLVSVAVFRELSPVLASTLVAAQGGSAFAAELGAMRISEELDATEIMAIDSLRTHVVPRFMAAVIAAPALNVIGCLAGITGGYVTAVWVKGQPSATYWDNLWELTHPADIYGGTFKALVFGVLIGLIACYQGYHATGGAAGVGKAVNDTVVISITTFIIVNYFLTSAMFGAITN
ncbi:MAG: ABC transporter permease [Alphaproteobacteria bacterium]|nr:ABC transporter permease [Alphaproteobacteria bacterium]